MANHILYLVVAAIAGQAAYMISTKLSWSVDYILLHVMTETHTREKCICQRFLDLVNFQLSLWKRATELYTRFAAWGLSELDFILRSSLC